MFLLPASQFMHTAQLLDNNIILLHETPFPIHQCYAISDHGLAACIDMDKKMIHYGFIQSDGSMTGHQALPFPEILSPECVVIIDHYLIFGGNCKSIVDWHGHSLTQYTEVIATYSVIEKEFQAVEMPHRDAGKGIDDLLIDGSMVIVVDNIVMPKYVIDYDFSDPANPILLRDHDLKEAGPNESIKKASMNDRLVALHSTIAGQTGRHQAITVFRKGEYGQHFLIEELYKEWSTKGDISSDPSELDERGYIIKKPVVSAWKDILLDPTTNTLFIAAMERGIGIIAIDEKDILSDLSEDEEEEEFDEEIPEVDNAAAIRYFQPFGWNVRKLIVVGENILVVGERNGEWALLPDEVRFAQ